MFFKINCGIFEIKKLKVKKCFTANKSVLGFNV